MDERRSVLHPFFEIKFQVLESQTDAGGRREVE